MWNEGFDFVKMGTEIFNGWGFTVQCSALTVTFIGFLMDGCCRSCNTFTLSVNGITIYL